jgi:hypothetical protein
MAKLISKYVKRVFRTTGDTKEDPDAKEKAFKEAFDFLYNVDEKLDVLELKKWLKI